MPAKKSYITITDQFCGAGGSSQGARNVSARIKGIEIRMALNHWKLAIDTHATNFPDTDHDCTDISACDPRRYPSTDILITSPECTNHSLAKGQKRVKAQMDLFASGKMDAAADRSRATMWDVPRFAEYHSYNIIIVENVVDAKKWIMFDSWIGAMHALGYKHRCVYLNSMFCHPTPQSRDRMYVVFWKKGNKAPQLDFTPKAWCSKCERDIYAVQTWKRSDVRSGVYGKRGQYIYCCSGCSSIVQPYYYAAFNCIDWSDIGKRIGDRKKELSQNTIRRIKYGLDKYGHKPFLDIPYTPGYTKSITDPSATITSKDHHAIATPLIINDQQSTGTSFRVKAADEYLQTLSTQPHMKMVFPFLIKEEHSQQLNVHSTEKHLPTQTTRQSMAVVNPWIIEMNKTGECKPAMEHASTITSGGINHAMMLSPLLIENKGKSKSKPVTESVGSCTTKDHHGIITHESMSAFISYYFGTSQATHVSEPLGSTRTKDSYQLISYKKPEIEDCFYRMLKPKEIKLAMAFDKDYTVLGSGKDQVKQLGNAVTPPAMEWLIEQCINSLK